MSYSYSFSQYPTKELDAAWNEIFEGKLGSRIEGELESLEKELEAALALPTLTGIDFQDNQLRMNERTKYDELEANGTLQWKLQERIKNRKEILASVKRLAQVMKKGPKDKEDALEAIASVNTAMEAILGQLCQRYSESTSENDFRFLEELYHRINGIYLSGVEKEITTNDWAAFFRSLKKDLLLEELAKMYEADRIQPEEVEEARGWYTRGLFIIRDMLKECLEKGWDLKFFTELWGMDEPEDFWNDSYKKQLETYYERLMEVPDFG